MKTFVLTLYLCLFALPAFATDKSESAMDRAIRTGDIRASYLIYPPYFMKDLKTGAFSGIFHDIMEAVGQNAGLKIVWTEEVGYENIFSGLDSGRYDVFAGGLWPDTTRAKVGLFSEPAFYSVIKAWGRADETRFQESLNEVNDASVRIATIDGAMEDIIARSDYPMATRVSLPQLSAFKQNLTNVTTGKADITFAEPAIIREFLKTNPDSLKELAPGNPVRIFGNSLVIKKGEHDFKAFLDVALRQLIYSGQMDRILDNYNAGPDLFPRVAKPYEVKQ